MLILPILTPTLILTQTLAPTLIVDKINYSKFSKIPKTV